METINALATVVAQLPESVKPLVQVKLKADPFLLMAEAYFKTKDGQVIEAKLGEGLKIPSDVMVRLCLL